MNERLNDLRKKIKKVLTKERYEHTLGVMYTAGNLAMAHGEDIDKAMIAGVLHDCAKCYPEDEMLSLCKKHNVFLSEFEINNHSLIHAKLGAALARDIYGIESEEIISAIRKHTTGDKEMNLLDKIIYVADYIEPYRGELPNIDGIRRIAFRDLDRAIFLIIDSSMAHLKERGKVVDPATEEAYEVFRGLINDRNNVRSTKIVV